MLRGPLTRRYFVRSLGGAAVAWPLTARAQQPKRMRRVGMLVAYAESDPEAQARVAAFRQGLRELGWTEGDNLRMELRWETGDPDRARTFATELISLAPDVIVAHGLDSIASSNAHDPSRIRLGHRPSRCRLRAQSGPTGR
jgi:putative ABC transport system substrate-binding protein